MSTQSEQYVRIFDTTLRDGEQSPGASMTGEEKLRIARALERLKVDVIEAGFAIASPGDFAAVKLVAANGEEAAFKAAFQPLGATCGACCGGHMGVLGAGETCITASTRNTSATVRAIQPTVSKLRDNSITPSRGVRACVPLKPTKPHKAAGTRMEPPVSEPRPATARPKATDTAAPDEEPPGMRATCASHGFTGVPWCGLMPTPEKANSVMLVLPIRAAPAARKRATAGASAVAAGSPSRTTEPAIVVSEATSYKSLMDTGCPAKGPKGTPARAWAT